MAEIDKSQLQLHNPWWLREELIEEDTKIHEFNSQKYKWYPPAYVNFPLDEDAVLTLRGPRQVGKTTLLKLLIRRLLLDEKFPRESIFFYPCDRVKDYDHLYEILRVYLDFAKVRLDSRLYIFLDEISFVQDWQRTIKEFADMGRFKKVTLVLTGSNILDIKYSSERLPGRRGKILYPDVEMLPLNFEEFLSVVAPDLKQMDYEEVYSLHFPELRKLFEDYLLTGGFLVNINNFYEKKFIPDYLYQMYISWIEGDLHKAGKSENVALKIFERLFIHLSSPVSYYKLARESGVASHVTVHDYLDILEKMFVLFATEHFSINQKKVESKKNRKVYFYDLFILQSFLVKAEGFIDEAFNYCRDKFLNDNLRPKIAEMLVASSLRRIYHTFLYRGVFADNEIDLAGKYRGQYSFYEVKYQSDLRIKDFLLIKKLSQKHKCTIISKNDLNDQDENLKLFPLEIFLGYKSSEIETKV
jgi:predicted AAA+ superfamily ATPase